MEIKHDIKITLLPNQYMHFPSFSINKQKGDKNSLHKSFQGISKPQINANEINYLEEVELPVISANHPSTKIPERKVSFMSKLSDMFSIEKQATPQQKSTRPQNRNQNRNRNRNRNQNRNRSRSQNTADKQKNTGNQNKNRNQNRNRNQKSTSNAQQKSTEKVSEKSTEKIT
jgi:ribonuclease E